MQLYGSVEKSILMQFNRTNNIEELNSSMKGQQVTICGWVEDLRKLGKMTFLTK
jgi:aspartyl-tRNA synthetase